MHIAIDASRTTVPNVTGTERYTLELLRHLVTLDTSMRFSLYFRDAPPEGLLPAGPNIRRRVVPFPRLWTHARFAAALWADRPDVTFVPAHTLPLLFPGPGAVTLHDMGHRIFPEAHPAASRLYLDWSTGHSARRAARVLVDSEATKADLIAFYATDPQKVHVVYPGLRDSIARVTDPAALARVRRAYRLPEKYLLFVSTLQPRKNVARLVQAYAQSRAHAQGVGLALAGKPGWLYNPAWTAGVPGVQELGYVPDADLAALYSGALAFCLPSLHEGFSFPILEAMRCGAPVIASTRACLPELVGDAGLTVDAYDVGALADAIRRVVTDPALRASMAERGERQAARFRWERAARETLDVLVRAAGG